MLYDYLNRFDTETATRKAKYMIGNGHLKVKIGKTTGTVYGGPYMQRPVSMFGVKLAPEIRRNDFDAYCPIKDFNVPDTGKLNSALMDVVQALHRRRDVYVGCMGGWGRTGLFLACLRRVEVAAMPWYRRAWQWLIDGGMDTSVEHVRSRYSDRAVETEEQEAFVRSFDPGIVVEWAKRVRYA